MSSLWTAARSPSTDGRTTSWCALATREPAPSSAASTTRPRCAPPVDRWDSPLRENWRFTARNRLNSVWELAPRAMTTTTATRRLAAILAADVAGYSRLMSADEEGTHERVKAHLREVVDPKIREHRGRIVKTTGDGVLAEFPSVVDAIRSAAEIQHAMAGRDRDLPEERRLRFRMGVNLGDV